MNSNLRRAELFAVAEADEPPIQIGEIRIVPGLTPKEFDLLMFLCKHRGKY